MPKTLIFLLLAAAGAVRPALADPAELFLAGGALRTCSDLAPGACRSPPPGVDARAASQFRVDDGGLSRALDPLLWADRPQAPPRATLAAMLASARRDASWERTALEDALDAYCVPTACASGDRGHPWRQLLDDERAAVLSALELPQLDQGIRRRERAHLALSTDQAGVEVLRAFVAAAAQRAGGARPRIAVVTASSLDPFDPVDFYLDAFQSLGADAQWWPVDAALQAAVAQPGGCARLDALRREHLRLSSRDLVYPDLGAQQWRACLDPEATARVPQQVQGIFFAGGDQWRHRAAFFDADDQPNAWLLALRKAHAAGTLVVGGSSAGTAVQGGAAMLSNGTSAQALKAGALARPPVDPGCSAAGRCPEGVHGDSLTYWPAGGLGLLPGWTADTHFSERARELRLLTLMHDAGVAQALGVDETSALHLTRSADALQVEALGTSGGWVFQRLPGDGSGQRRVRAHYLAPGVRFTVKPDGLHASVPLAKRLKAPAGAGEAPVDALADGALRSAAALLASGREQITLRAGDGRVVLARSPQTRVWRAPGGGVGILALTLSYEPPPAP